MSYSSKSPSVTQTFSNICSALFTSELSEEHLELPIHYKINLNVDGFVSNYIGGFQLVSLTHDAVSRIFLRKPYLKSMVTVASNTYLILHQKESTLDMSDLKYFRVIDENLFFGPIVILKLKLSEENFLTTTSVSFKDAECILNANNDTYIESPIHKAIMKTPIAELSSTYQHIHACISTLVSKDSTLTGESINSLITEARSSFRRTNRD